MIPIHAATNILIDTTTLFKGIVAITIGIAWAIAQIDMARLVATCIKELELEGEIGDFASLTEELIPLEGEHIGQVRLHILHQRRES